MKEIMMGFTFQIGKTGVFVRTEKRNKTVGLAKEILNALKLPVNPKMCNKLLGWMERAACQIEQKPDGKRYCEISGEWFDDSGYLEDGSVVIVEI